MNPDQPARIKSVQAVYGFVMVMSILCLVLGGTTVYQGGPVWSGPHFNHDVYSRLQVFGWLLATFAFALPFTMSTVRPSDFKLVAANADAARELVEQQYVDHTLFALIVMMIACIYSALLIWIAGHRGDMLVGTLVGIIIAGRFPHAAAFEEWSRRCGVTPATTTA